MNHAAAKMALQFYLDHGVDEALLDEAQDRTVLREVPKPSIEAKRAGPPLPQSPASDMVVGKSERRDEAVKLAKAAQTIDALRDAVASFDGVTIKKTATNLVFCDGNPDARVMVIGEAPGADEDRQGKPFVGVTGQLLDRILKCINLGRDEEDVAQAVYMSNILNWRPPGNRTPSLAEIELSLPFIERHIQLVQPDLLIFCGGVSAKSLLGSTESISRLRKRWHDYTPQTPELTKNAKPISAIVTYHPEYLLKTPAQKRSVWADMLEIQKKLKELS